MTRPLTIAALCLALFLAGAISSAWNCDDSYIAFRYSRSLGEGQGLRYNLGVEPPVEGYTQLGWVLWIGAFEWAGIDPVPVSRTTGIVAGALLLLALLRTASRRFGGDSLATLTVGLVFATSPSVLVWATGGLGTMPFALAVFLLWERLSADPERPRVRGALLAGLAVLLLRADSPFWVALIGGFALLEGVRSGRRVQTRAAFTVSLTLLLAFIGLLAFRYSVHGDWIPNTARNKVGLTSLTMWRGVQYVLHYWATIPSALLLLALAPLTLRDSENRWLLSAWLVALATFAYGILVGGDFMAFGRFFVPAWPMLALCGGALVRALARRRGALPACALMLVFIGGSLPARYDVPLTPTALREQVQFRWGMKYASEFGFWQSMQSRCDTWIQLGRALALHTQPEESLVRGAIGAIGYYSRLFVFDQLGLVNRDVVARIEVNPKERRLPGHDRKAHHRFFAEWKPTYRRAGISFGVRTLPDGSRVPLKEEPLAWGEELFPIYAADGFRDDGFLHLYDY